MTLMSERLKHDMAIKRSLTSLLDSGFLLDFNELNETVPSFNRT